jgi:hypothetical protein
MTPKERVMLYMAGTQPLEHVMSKTIPWYVSGDKRAYREIMSQVAHDGCNKCIKGDDMAFRLADGTLVSADVSSNDAGVTYRQKQDFVLKLRECWQHHPMGPAFVRYVGMLHYWMAYTDIYCGYGALQRGSGWGNLSGSPDTTQLNTWRNEAVVTAVLAAKVGQEDVVEEMSKYVLVRQEKQIFSNDVLTICQQVYNKRRPQKIHGIVPRAIRALGEREDVRLTFPNIPKHKLYDMRVVAILANCYGATNWKSLVDWVGDHWELRTDKKTLIGLFESWSAANSKPTGILESQGLRLTLKRLFA